MFEARIPVIYGAASIGAPGTFCTLTDATQAQHVVDAWCEIVRTDTQEPEYAIDTSNVYGFGTSEKILGQMDLHGGVVDTKIYPLMPGGHSRAKLREACDRTLTALGRKCVRVLYLNAPDHATPFEETLAAMDELHKEGKFEVLGLSNYRTHEVAEIVTISRAHGWIVPEVYQGVYNAVDRTVEAELIPCLRRFGIRFAAYCPLAGGYLVGNLLFEPELESNSTNHALVDTLLLDLNVNLDLGLQTHTHQQHELEQQGVNALIPIPRLPLRDLQDQLRGSGRHFDPQNPFGLWYRTRYLHPQMNDAVLKLCTVLEFHNLTLHSASVRWLQHHSALLPADLGIVFGGRTPEQVRETLKYCTQGPLPDTVVDAFEECYTNVRKGLPGFWCDPGWNGQASQAS
ncbi:NADP-dependent oxidoreductase domain-containing protein [Mycena amicta]|nr:NADP-dependent oxidoreductase domain-containing protein [Mycena amicta]